MGKIPISMANRIGFPSTNNLPLTQHLLNEFKRVNKNGLPTSHPPHLLLSKNKTINVENSREVNKTTGPSIPNTKYACHLAAVDTIVGRRLESRVWNLSNTSAPILYSPRKIWTHSILDQLNWSSNDKYHLKDKRSNDGEPHVDDGDWSVAGLSGI
jgi:hypothetical protein